MNERTANIIWISKGHHNYGDVTLKQAVAHYMSEECDCPIEAYTDRVLLSIVWEAFMDFMQTCDNPRAFLYRLKDAKYWCDYSPREGVDDVQAILIAFQLCRVRDDKGCVNGFTEELIAQLNERWEIKSFPI